MDTDGLSISADEFRQFARAGAAAQLEIILSEFPELREQLVFGTNGHPVPAMPPSVARRNGLTVTEAIKRRRKRGRPRKTPSPTPTAAVFHETASIHDAILQVVATHAPVTMAEVVSHLEAGRFTNTKSKNLKGLTSATMGRMSSILGYLTHTPKGPHGEPALWEPTPKGLKHLAAATAALTN